MIAGLHKVAFVLLAAGCNAGGIVAVDAGDGESTRGEANTSETSEYASVDASTTVAPDSSGESGPNYGGTSFIVDHDLGSSAFACDHWAQDCPPGEKCMPWGAEGRSWWDGLRCQPIDPQPVADGDACVIEGWATSGVDNCERGSMCWDVDDANGIGTCVAMCSGNEASPTCLAPQMECIVINGVIAVCLPSCDPLTQDCGQGQGCYPLDDVFACAPAVGGDEGSFGDPCAFINVCEPGLFCADAEGVPNCVSSEGCCSTFCDVSDPTASAACPGAAGGQGCVAFYAEGQAPPGYDDVGVCVIP